MTCKTHLSDRRRFAAFARFNRTVDFHLAFGNRDFRLRAAFAPAFQFQQVAQLNVRMLPKENVAMLLILWIMIFNARL